MRSTLFELYVTQEKIIDTAILFFGTIINNLFKKRNIYLSLWQQRFTLKELLKKQIVILSLYYLNCYKLKKEVTQTKAVAIEFNIAFSNHMPFSFQVTLHKFHLVNSSLTYHSFVLFHSISLSPSFSSFLYLPLFTTHFLPLCILFSLSLSLPLCLSLELFPLSFHFWKANSGTRDLLNPVALDDKSRR